MSSPMYIDMESVIKISLASGVYVSLIASRFEVKGVAMLSLTVLFILELQLSQAKLSIIRLKFGLIRIIQGSSSMNSGVVGLSLNLSLI